MDKESMDKYTENWTRETGNGKVELWQFFDKVYWETRFAIKINGEVKSILPKEKGNPFDFYDVVCECLE